MMLKRDQQETNVDQTKSYLFFFRVPPPRCMLDAYSFCGANDSDQEMWRHDYPCQGCLCLLSLSSLRQLIPQLQH